MMAPVLAGTILSRFFHVLSVMGPAVWRPLPPPCRINRLNQVRGIDASAEDEACQDGIASAEDDARQDAIAAANDRNQCRRGRALVSGCAEGHGLAVAGRLVARARAGRIAAASAGHAQFLC